MRRWICCGGHRSGDSDISNDEKHLKTQWHHQQPADGMCNLCRQYGFVYLLVLYTFDEYLCMFLCYNTCNAAANNKQPRPQPVAKPDPPKESLPIEVPPLSVEEVEEKTDNFGSKSLIGEGSYGRVYFATLSDGNKAVALKKLDVSPEAESNTEFLTQVRLLP